MYNKCLEYLLSNDSDDVMSESGIEFRKFIHPVVIRVGKLLGPDKYVLIKREPERIKKIQSDCDCLGSTFSGSCCVHWYHRQSISVSGDFGNRRNSVCRERIYRDDYKNVYQ